MSHPFIRERERPVAEERAPPALPPPPPQKPLRGGFYARGAARTPPARHSVIVLPPPPSSSSAHRSSLEGAARVNQPRFTCTNTPPLSSGVCFSAWLDGVAKAEGGRGGGLVEAEHFNGTHLTLTPFNLLTRINRF